MIIEIKVFSSLRHFIPDSDRRLDDIKWKMPEGSSVEQILNHLNMPDEGVKVCLINGRKVERKNILKEGDLLHIFPLMAGG